MRSSRSERRDEMLTVDRPAAPAPVRYPQSAVRYLLSSLKDSGPRPMRFGPLTNRRRERLRRMRRSAKPLLWWMPFWYVLGQLALFAWMDRSWELTRTQMEQEKWEQLHVRLAEAPDKPLVLMLGSSRTDWAFQAGRLNGQTGPDGRPLLAYNLGVQTTGPIHSALYLNDLLNEGVRPRLLLVEYVATHLNQSRRNLVSEEHFTVPRWLSWHQLAFMQRYFSNPRKAKVEWLEARLAPWYGFRWSVHEHLLGRHYHSMKHPFDQSERPMDDWGARELEPFPHTRGFHAWRSALAVNMYGESLRNFQLGKKPVKALRDLLARCRREQIPVALIKLPMADEFYQRFNAQARADLEKLYRDLCREYGAHAIDATHWVKEEELEDGLHVLDTGAYTFTTRMIDEVHKLLALTEPQPAQQQTP